MGRRKDALCVAVPLPDPHSRWRLADDEPSGGDPGGHKTRMPMQHGRGRYTGRSEITDVMGRIQGDRLLIAGLYGHDTVTGKTSARVMVTDKAAANPVHVCLVCEKTFGRVSC